MKKGKADYKKVYSQIRMRYLVAGTILILLFFTRQVIIQYQIMQDEKVSRIINVAGKQRMYGQKVVKEVLLINQEKDYKKREHYFEQLKDTLDIWRKAHYNLKHRNGRAGLHGKNSKIVQEMFEDIEGDFQKMEVAVGSIIEMLEEKNQEESLFFKKMTMIQKVEEVYLRKMDQIVNQYDQEDREMVRFIEKMELMLFSLILVMIGLFVMFVFIPAERTLEGILLELNENNENIVKLLHTIHGALFIIRENGDILTMNKDAQRLIIKNYSRKEKNLVNDIQWYSKDGKTVLEILCTEEKTHGIEVEIKDNKGEKGQYLISSVSGKYEGAQGYLVSMFNISEQKKAEEAMKNLAIKDELTGLYNRHFLDSIIAEEIDRSERYDVPLAGLILDLDHFKEVNDRWGHPIGDSVLQQTAEMISENVRESDYVIRLGGEEFLILMPHTGLEGACAVAEKIRKVIGEGIHPIVGKYTASLGVAKRRKGETFRNLYKRMDNALYQAKEGGRNCFVVSSNSGDDYTTVALQWKKGWNSGEGKIDQQHRELIHLANSLLNESFVENSKETTLDRLDDLLNHMEHHFSYEEKVLEQIQYPDYIRHKEIHKKLVEKGRKIQQNAINSEIDVMGVINYIFEELIIGHLLREDVKFYPYTKNESRKI